MLTAEQLIEVAKQEDIRAFVRFNQIKNEKGDLLNWDNHQFLLDIYNDWSPVQTCCKSSQIGFSTMIILKALWAAKFKKWNIIYTLPTGGDVNTFVSSKVNKIIENNPSLANLVKDKDTIFEKQVGNSVIFFKGTATGKSSEHKTEASQGIMISSDLNIHDESDRSDQTIIEQYESRLDFSKFKGKWYFSNPTVPNIGAHKWFLQSDQKHFFHQCSRCNEWFYMEWNDKCIDRNNECYLCPKCGRPLSDDDRRKGEWVRKYNDKSISGYWINQMMAPWKSCKELLLKEKNNSKTHFNNFVLGLPYIGSDIAVNRQVIVKNIIYTQNKAQNCALGVDNGIDKHYVLGNAQGIFKVGKTQDWDEIERLIKQYQPVTVIDALPYPKKPKELVEKYKHRVFMNFYKKDKDDLSVIRWGKKEQSGVVYADRTKIIDEVIEQFYSGKITFNIGESVLEQEDYIKHWESLYLAEVEDSMGIKRTSWESSDGNDHLAHCLCEDTKITIKGGTKEIKDIQEGDEVLTTIGYRPVLKSWKVEDNAKIMKIYFSNGSYLEGTKEHKIKTSRGWLTLDALIYDDIIEVVNNYLPTLCQMNQSSLMESNLDVIQTQKKGLIECILRHLGIIEKKVLVDCIKKFGKILMVKFIKVSQYITKTAIRLTMRLATWSVCLVEDIKANTCKKDLGIATITKEHVNCSKIFNLYHMHSEHAYKTLVLVKPKKFKCIECGIEAITRSRVGGKFCNKRCLSRWWARENRKKKRL